MTAAFLLMLLLAALPFSVSDGVAAGMADSVQPLVYCALEPPQGQSHYTKVTSVEAEPELELMPNMLTAIVIVGGSAHPPNACSILHEKSAYETLCHCELTILAGHL